MAGFGWKGTLSVKGWLLTDAPLIAAIDRDAQAMQCLDDGADDSW